MLFNLVILISSIVVMTFFLRKFFKQNRERRRNPRKWLTPNATNYNLESMSLEVIENMSPEEARETIRKVKESEMTSLSPKDFYALKKKIKSAESTTD